MGIGLRVLLASVCLNLTSRLCAVGAFCPSGRTLSHCDCHSRASVGGGRCHASHSKYPASIFLSTDSIEEVTNETGSPPPLADEEVTVSLDYLASMIGRRIDEVRSLSDNKDKGIENDGSKRAYILAKGRFADLTITDKSERALEDLFLVDHFVSPNNITVQPTGREVRYAICAVQSLLVFGTQVGVKGPDDLQKKMVRHLFRRDDPPPPEPGTWDENWDAESIRRLKFHRDTKLGKQVLARLIRKRSAQGAFDLLVAMGIWDRHEDTALLRSGFPIRFTEDELGVSKDAESNEHDPDKLLGLRRDMRDMKVYTIDGESTSDVDDGLSIEAVDDGGQRYWIHIADVDRWAPRGSKLLDVGERRGTSLYLPTCSLNMFPENMCSDIMSLQPWEDKCALSLGVELNEDGSIIDSSIIVTPSLINVDYGLTYDQVDEMLDEGIAYSEEWQIGALLSASRRRRAHRVSKGSTEGMVPHPIPRGVVNAKWDTETDEYDIKLSIETTHNSGANVTASDDGRGHYDPYCMHVSSSQLIVTEMMILAGEALGKWQRLVSTETASFEANERVQTPNVLELPFRRQPAPDFKSREREFKHLNFLSEMKLGYPQAWYARRFFNKAIVSEEYGGHFGLGLDCYVQWSSPIRRLTDLQVHSAVKRYLRRAKVNQMLREGTVVPVQLSDNDLGYRIENISNSVETRRNIIDLIDYRTGLGKIFSARPIQFSSSRYWLYEHVRRLVEESDDGEVAFECIVLGCVNTDRFQYAVYLYELGLEHRYVSASGKLEDGLKLWLKVESVNPRAELLKLSPASSAKSNAPAA